MAQTSYPSDLPTDAYPATGATAPSNQGLSSRQKKMMGITAATLLLSGGVGLVLANWPKKDPDQLPGEETPATGATPAGTLPDGIDAAGKVTDQMTFKQAFQAARDEVGMGGVFNWHGRWYNTFEKEEWDSLSLEQRQEYAEMITGEKLPVTIKPVPPVVSQPGTPADSAPAPEPTVIEGYLQGQRVMGLDFDNDGTIDTLVLEGADGYTYRVVDETGNDGLDMLYRYDPLNGELMEIEKIDEPFILTNAQFSQGLEDSMSREIVDSILETEVPPAPGPTPADEADELVEPAPAYSADDATTHFADASDLDDTYINNGDVHDMDN